MNGILLPYILISKGRQFDIEKLAIFVLERRRERERGREERGEREGETGREGGGEGGREEGWEGVGWKGGKETCLNSPD